MGEMIPRTLGAKLLASAGPFPIVFLTGPRQSGKTTLAKATFPSYRYVSLEDLQNREEAQEDPRGFLGRLRGEPGTILDEVQRVPDLFSYLQVAADEGAHGPFVLTGSQHFLLSQHVSQTLAGRVAVLELLPLSVAELARRVARDPTAWEVGLRSARAAGVTNSGLPGLDDTLYAGFYPRIHDRGLDPAQWLDGYVRTYVERDARLVGSIGDLGAFTRFVALCAGRSGQLLNLSALGADAGVSHTTARAWLSVLETSYLVTLVKPHHVNFNKRVVKTPKLVFLDSGLLCRLLGLRRAADLAVHPLRGAVFESFVVAELIKVFVHHGERAPLCFWRDSHGTEVDAILDFAVARVAVEAKSGVTVAADAFRGLDSYCALSAGRGVLAYGGDECYERRGHVVCPWWMLT
jgi:predicted AAA+ superfamily ATPase